MDYILKRIKSKKTILIISASLFWGLLAHGMMFFDKYSTHDDINMFIIGATHSSGRWMLYHLGSIYTKLFGMAFFSTPAFNGIITILYIAVICLIITEVLNIESNVLVFFLSGVMVVFPTITGLFGFMFTAPYYLAGVLIGISGISFFYWRPRWYTFILACVLATCSAAVYQANIPVYVSFALITLIKKIAEQEKADNKKTVFAVIYYAGICICSVVLYLIVIKYQTVCKSLELTYYEGINTFGKTDLFGYMSRIKTAYWEFIEPTPETSRNMYPVATKRYYQISLIIGVVFSILFVIGEYKKNRFNAFCILLLVFLLPLACNLIYVMCDLESVHNLMMYGEVFHFVFLIRLVDNSSKHKKYKVGFVAVILALLTIVYCKFDNICYLKADIYQERIISYYTTLVTRIKSVPGYNDSLPVAYINEFNKKDGSFAEIPEFDIIDITPYASYFSINDYKWRTSMKIWCGFDPIVEEGAYWGNNNIVTEMPNYPDDGSIRVVDGIVVVKF